MWSNFVFFWFFFSLFLWILTLQFFSIEFLFFSLGASVTFLISFFLPADYFVFLWIELLIFFILSFLGFILFYKKLKESTKTEKISILSEEILNSTGICSEKISPTKDGSIFSHGSYWKASSSDIIEVGEKIQIVKQKELTLIVKKL